MKNMRKSKIKSKSKSKTQLGLFLFFLSGLFVLQIVFACTIHGDIGPHSDVIPGLSRPASPNLIGRMDSIIDKNNFKVSKVVPEGAFAPATRGIEQETLAAVNKVVASAKIDSQTVEQLEAEKNVVHSTSIDRFAEYRVQKGDTLQKISKKLYGNYNMVQPLVRINRISSEKGLQLGSCIKVPRSGLVASIKIED